MSFRMTNGVAFIVHKLKAFIMVNMLTGHFKRILITCTLRVSHQFNYAYVVINSLIIHLTFMPLINRFFYVYSMQVLTIKVRCKLLDSAWLKNVCIY